MARAGGPKPSAPTGSAFKPLKSHESEDKSKNRREGFRVKAEEEEAKTKTKSPKAKKSSTPGCNSGSRALPAVRSPKRAGDVDVDMKTLIKPAGLKQRYLPELHLTGLGGDGDDLSIGGNSVDTSQTSKTSMSKLSQALEESDEEEPAEVPLSTRLLGLPGNLDMTEEQTCKYFGFEGRYRFMQRIQWISQQRNITCFESDQDTDSLFFVDKEDIKPIGASIPFGAKRPNDKGGDKGKIDFAASFANNSTIGNSSNSSITANSTDGSTFFERFKADSESMRNSSYFEVEDMMLKMSRMRSGDDYRDEEDLFDNNPLAQSHREKSMLEDLNRILEKEKNDEENNKAFDAERIYQDSLAQKGNYEEDEASKRKEQRKQRSQRLAMLKDSEAGSHLDKNKNKIYKKNIGFGKFIPDKQNDGVIDLNPIAGLQEAVLDNEYKVRNLFRRNGKQGPNSWMRHYEQNFGHNKLEDASTMDKKDKMDRQKQKQERKLKAESEKTALPTTVTFEALSEANRELGPLPGPSEIYDKGDQDDEDDKDDEGDEGDDEYKNDKHIIENSGSASELKSPDGRVYTPVRRPEGKFPQYESNNNNESGDTESALSTARSSSDASISMRTKMTQIGASIEMPLSPRSKYINSCVRDRLNPRASLVIRKNMTKKLELQNYGMGDEMAAILAESISDLPFLESINIADNRLTDAGMGPIILAAVEIENLLELNLSMNEIGDVSADALASYLRREDCPLQRLIMQTADVDDFEAEAFIDAVKENRSLLELDLSSNLIGGAENLNTVYPDLTTGSEALADLLRIPGIKLHTLKLVWNMIRLDGAVDFCSSLSVNDTLTFLDLSYNSLAQDGGIALGVALEYNKTLETILIANNNIDAVACFTICVGVISNHHLKKIVFDGNPIAEQGARALMLIPMHAGGRVAISAAKCNITMKDPRCWFDFQNPIKHYDLNLDDGFERAVAKVLLMIIACHHSYIFEFFELNPAVGKPQVIELKQALSTEKLKFFTKPEKKIVKSLTRIADSASDIQAAVRLFQEVDEDESGEVDREELGQLIDSMGINMTQNRMDDIFNMYDVDGGGSIGLSEFLSFLKTQKQESVARIKDMCEMPVMILADGSQDLVPKSELRSWSVPSSGSLKCGVKDGFATKPIKRVMSSTDHANINQVVEAAADGGNTSAMLAHGLVGTKLRIDEALACCTTMLMDGKDSTKVLRMVLPQIDSHNDAQSVVKAITNGDRSELMRLKREIGHALRPIMGAPNGYYVLDLSDEMDKFCFNRLLEISKTQAARRQDNHNFFNNTQIGDLSQKRNWSCFRNEQLNSDPVTIDEKFADRIPRNGHLEFDFISAIRPDREEIILPDARVIKVLVNSHLMEPEDCVNAFNKMKHYMETCEGTLDCDGNNVYEVPTKRAHHIGLALSDFYDNIEKRRKMYHLGILKENQVKLDSKGRIPDDLDDDIHHIKHGHDENNKSGYYIGTHGAIQASMKVRGFDPEKKKSKRGSFVDNDDGKIDEDDDDDETDSQITAHDSISLSSAALESRNWICEECEHKNTDNMRSGCENCNSENPKFKDNMMSHEQMVKKTVAKKGAVEHASHINLSDLKAGHEIDPSAPLIQLKAHEHAAHDKNEMGSDYSSDLENDSDDNDEISKSSSESEKGDDELNDIKKYMKEQIKSKTICQRAKKAAARAERRKIREKEKKMLRSRGVDFKENDEDEEEEEEEEGENKGDKELESNDYAKRALSNLNFIAEDEIHLDSDVNTTEDNAGEYEARKLERLEREKLAEETALDNQAIGRKTDADIYADKMVLLLESPTVHVGLKANRIVEWLEEIFGRVWIRCRHLMLILECVRGIGHKKRTKYFGTYRCDLIVALFHRLVDMHNFEIVLKALSPFEVAAVTARVGWLHIWNPCKPEGGWELDITRPEERLVAKMLCELATVEPGDNWVEQYFQWQRDSEGMPGWELTTPWLSEEGMPCRGILTLNYYSGQGKGRKGCKPNISFRKSLLLMTLIEEWEIVEEGFRERLPKKPIGEAYMFNNSSRWKQYLGSIVDLTRTR